MNRDELKARLRDRKIVIIAQLGVLAFILVGLLGSSIIPEKQTATKTVVNLEDVSVTKELPEITPINNVSVRAEAVYIWDVRAGQVLYEKNAEKSLPLASITKLMTTLLAYELINEDTEASITAQALRQDGETGFVEGERLSLKNLTHLALLSSSNDAAFALAAAVGNSLGDKDPASQFISGMNIRAEELGLDSLEFKNPTGLDISLTEPGATGSAKDVSLLVEYILNNYPELLEPTQDSAARVYSNSGEYHDAENTNQALYAIPNLLGSKTGYTDLAGGNLTIAYDAGFDRPIIITVLGSTYSERFTDVLTLMRAVNETIK